MNKTPDIYISISDFFSDEYIEMVDKALQANNLNLVVQTVKRESAFASLLFGICNSEVRSQDLKSG